MENTNDTPIGIYILRILTLCGICGALSSIAASVEPLSSPGANVASSSFHLMGEFLQFIFIIVAVVAIFSKEKWAWIYLTSATISQILALVISIVIFLPTTAFPEFVLFAGVSLVVRILTLGYFMFDHVAAHFRVFEMTREVKIYTAIASLAFIGFEAFIFLLGIL